jgi:RNA polymerase sigma-70 factor (ECF subfamily)
MGLVFGDPFADWEIRIAKQVVGRFLAKNSWLKGLDFDDLIQECLIHWYKQRIKFQRDKGASRKTFMAKVLSNRLQMILREQLTDRRRAFHQAESLEKLQAEEETSPLKSNPAYEDFSDLSLRLDMEFILKTLTPRQREICALLEQGYPITKIAAMLGKPRSTIYDEIIRMREVFSERGLQSYLK